MAETETQYHINGLRWAEATAARHAAYVQANQSEASVLWVSDVDGPLINSDLAWHGDYSRLATEKGVPEESIVDLATFAPSPRTHYQTLNLVSDYSLYKDWLMSNGPFHADMRAADDAAATLPALAARNVPGGYISARPEVIGGVTRQSLDAAGFAPAPLLMRSKDVAYDQTIVYKCDPLLLLVRALARHKATANTLVKYVEDYERVVTTINNLGIPQLSGVYYGPHTTWNEILSSAV
ncbi:MAG TPA: hypothetical protein VLG11_00605 [Candidatus Saccharimonadales bacterium]|nr:hypothetical protein [Candidatus Saccharimonadales bacterium]